MTDESLSSSQQTEVADRLHSAAIHLLRRIRKVDEASGLSAARLSALSVLVFGGPTTLGALARAEQVSAPTMSRLVSGLERDGFVVREVDEGDVAPSVCVRVRATPKGRRVLVPGPRAARRGARAAARQGVSADELRTLGSAAEDHGASA